MRRILILFIVLFTTIVSSNVWAEMNCEEELPQSRHQLISHAEYVKAMSLCRIANELEKLNVTLTKIEEGE